MTTYAGALGMPGRGIRSCPRADGPPVLLWPEDDGGTRAICDCLDAVGDLLGAVADALTRR